MKFSFNKSKTNQKSASNALKPKFCIENVNEQKEETKMNVDSQKNHTDSDPRTIFKQQYEIAITSAENSNFPESLRAFDIAIRFWCIYFEKLKEEYPSNYKKFKFPDINACDSSNYFLNLYKKNKDVSRKKTKKKLWKPPPKHQPQNNENNENKENKENKENNDNDDNDEEIIYFKHSNSDDDDDVDLVQDKNEMIKEWEKLLLYHKKIGSEMYEYHAQVLLEMDRDFEAIKAAQSAILLNEMNEINWLTLSRSEFNFGDPFQSLLSISRAIELNFENDEIIEHFSNVYAICNKLREMKKNGKMTDDVLKRRLVVKTKYVKKESERDIKLVKQRLEKRGNSNDHIGRMDNKTDTQHIVENYQNIIQLTKKLKIDNRKNSKK